MLTTEQAARATGMKVAEIVDIEAIDGGYRVTTHDGQHVALAAEHEPQPEPAKAPAKAPARRGKS